MIIITMHLFGLTPSTLSAHFHTNMKSVASVASVDSSVPSVESVEILRLSVNFLSLLDFSDRMCIKLLR